MNARILGSTLLLALGVPAWASAGGLTWEKDLLDVEAGPEQAEVRADFGFHNAGDRAVTVTEIQTSCGCTTAWLAKKTYASGEAGHIRVVFTVADRTGTQEKFIRVKTDAPGEDEPMELELRIAIHAYFSFEPKAVFWKTGEAPVEKTITCRALLPAAMALVAAEPADAAVQARIEVVEPGRKVLLHLRPRSTATALDVPVHLRFHIENAARDRTFDAFAEVAPPGAVGG
jgi:hypothetical protein